MSRAPILALLGALAASACADDVGVVTTSDGTTSDATTDAPATSGTSGGDELGASEEVSGHADTTAAPDTTDADTTAGVDPTADGTTSSATTGGEDTSTGDPPQWCDDADCDDADPCTDDTCDENTQACVHTLAPGNPCDDGDACTQADVCQPDGTCSGDDTCTVEHCGTIASDETWGPDVVHVLTCFVYVEGPANPTLTILDGTTVLAEPGMALLIGNGDPGRMEVQGADLGVSFSNAQPLPGGAWYGLIFGSYHTDSQLVGATIEHAGGSDDGALTVVGIWGSLVVTDTIIRESPGRGVLAVNTVLELHDSSIVDNGETGIVLMEDATLEMHGTSVIGNGGDGIAFEWGARIAELPAPFTDNEITQNGGAPLRMATEDIRKLDASSTYAGNEEPIEVIGAAVTSGTWPGLDEVYTIHPSLDLWIQSETGAPVVIEVEPGATFVMDPGERIYIDSGSNAVLLAHGTADAPIQFIGGEIDFWGWPGNDVAPSELHHVVVEAGEGVEVFGADVQITDSVVRGNSGAAAIQGDYTSDLVITGTVVEDNAGYGVRLHRPPSAPLTDNVIIGNGVAMDVDAEVPELIASSTIIAGNGEDVVRVAGSVTLGDTTWPLLAVPYRVGVVWVTDSNVLTIDPGVTLELEQDALLELGHVFGSAPSEPSPGGLSAIGTSEAPIIFRSADATPWFGDWAGIHVNSFALPTTLEHCVVQHAGGDGFDGAIVVQTDAVTISSCTIADSASWGIYQDGATATLSGNTFSGNLSGDVFP